MSVRIERLRSGSIVLAALCFGCAGSYDSRPVRVSATEYLAEKVGVAGGSSLRDESAEALYGAADLGAYVEFALVHHHGLEAAFERWRAALASVGVVSALANPRLSYGHFLEQVQTRTGAQRRTFGLSQAFPWPGTLDARARVAARKADVLLSELEAQRARVASRVAVAYHDYAFLGQEIAITRNVLELVQSLEPVVQARVRSGAGQEDLLRIQVEIGRLADDHSRVTERRRVLSARLADAMNLAVEDPRLLPLPEQDLPGEAGVLDGQELLAQALERNPGLATLGEKLRVARSGQKLAGLSGRPDFSVGLSYIQTGEALNPAARGSGDDPLLLSASIGLPVWQGKYSAERRRADHEVRAVQADLAATRSSLRADLEDLVFQVNDASRRTRLYRDSLLPRAREAVQLNLVAYRAGSTTVLDLLDSERALLEFELIYRRAIHDYLQGRARLVELTGGENS